MLGGVLDYCAAVLVFLAPSREPCALVWDGKMRVDLAEKWSSRDGWLVTCGLIIKGIPIINVYLVGVAFLYYCIHQSSCAFAVHLLVF